MNAEKSSPTPPRAGSTNFNQDLNSIHPTTPSSREIRRPAAHDYRRAGFGIDILRENHTVSFRQDPHPNIDAAASRIGQKILWQKFRAFCDIDVSLQRFRLSKIL